MAEKSRVLLFGYGFMGEPALKSLLGQPSLEVSHLIAPPMGVGRYRPTGDVLPMETLAKDRGVEYTRISSTKTSNKEAHNIIERTSPDIVLVATYDQVLWNKTVNLPPQFYNVHHGNLPKKRGSSGSEWQVINGEPEVTMTLHELTQELDAGDIIWQPEVPIGPDDTIVTVRENMNARLERSLGGVFAHILNPSIAAPEGETVGRREQVGDPTYTASIRGGYGEIDWTKPTRTIHNLIRGLAHPELERAFTFKGLERMEVWSSRIPEQGEATPYEPNCSIPGQPVKRSRRTGEVEVLTGDGSIIIKEVAPYEGQKVPATELIDSTRIRLHLDHLALLKRMHDLEKRLGE